MRIWAAALALVASGASAQSLDCSNPSTQVEMTGCASVAYEAADAKLNFEYRLARDRAREMDQDLRAGDIPAAELLRDAQRAWLPFRDAACSAESLIARGGTMQSQLYLMCLTRLTEARTDDLRRFGMVN